MGDQYLDCEIRLAEAKDLFATMKDAENGTKLKGTFIGFLEITKTIFFPLKRYSQTLDDYKNWWKGESEKLEKNTVAKFFYNQRNDVVKGGNDLIEVRSISAKGARATIKGPLMIYKCQVFRPKNGNAKRYVPYHDVSGFKLEWDFIQKPINKDPVLLCEEYLDILEQVLESFIERFPDILVE